MTCGCSNLGREAQITEMAAVNAELKAKLAAVRQWCDTMLASAKGIRDTSMSQDYHDGRIEILQSILAILDGGTD